jgi:hypothetical protein
MCGVGVEVGVGVGGWGGVCSGTGGGGGQAGTCMVRQVADLSWHMRCKGCRQSRQWW